MSDGFAWCLGASLLAVGGAADWYLVRSFLRSGQGKRRRRRSGGAAMAALGLWGVGAAAAQTADPGAAGETGDSVVEKAIVDSERSRIAFQLNFDATTAYFYRGIIQEDSGLILQPAARVTMPVIEADGIKVDAFVSVWNSIHSQETGADSGGGTFATWYEADIAGGVVISSGPVSFTASYTALTSPNGAFATVQELGATLALDDSAWLKAWALKPYATIAFEIGDDASDGADSDSGIYGELGISPGLTFDAGSTPITLTFPVAVGVSLSDYYQDANGNDSTFGYLQVGAKAAIPLGDAGPAGTWNLNLGVSWLLLGEHTKAYNSGDDSEIIGTIGVQWNF